MERFIGRIVERRDGSQWRIISGSRTSDGFLIGTAVLLDPETGDELQDESGFPILHSVFLG